MSQSDYIARIQLGHQLSAALKRAEAAEAKLAELVPEEITSALREQIIDICDGFEVGDSGAKEIWKACRATILRNIEG